MRTTGLRAKGLGLRERLNSLFLALSLWPLALSPVFAAFENIGAGARPIAMGNAFSAVADDANTIYYNPAGLGRLKHPQLTAGYGRLYLGLTDGSNIGSGFIGATTPLHDGAMPIIFDNPGH